MPSGRSKPRSVISTDNDWQRIWLCSRQVGHLPANIDIPWRQSAMTGDVTPLGADLTGGWITGSEAGAWQGVL